MSRPRVTDHQQGFSGGLNSSADEARLGADEVRVARNYLLTLYGAAQRRQGTQRVSTAAIADPIQGGFGWTSTGDTLVVAGGTLYTTSYGTLPIAFNAEIGTLSALTVPDFAAFTDGVECVYIADGGPLNKWNGTTFTGDMAGTPNVSRLAVYNRRLFGISGDSQTLYWSALDDGDTLGNAAAGGGEAIIRTFSDSILTALATVGASLLIYHISGISRFTGWTQDDINIAAGSSGLTSDVGCKAPRTVVSLENEILFLSDRGFYSATENEISPISMQIDSDVAGLTGAAQVASFSLHFRTRREVWFYVGGVGFYVFNYRLRRWSGPQSDGYVLPVTTCAWDDEDENRVPIALCGDEGGWVKRMEAPLIWKDNVNADGTGGAAIEGVIQLHRMFTSSRRDGTPDMETTKSWRWGYLLMDALDSEDISVEWDTQFGDNSYDFPITGAAWGAVGGEWGAGTWGGSGVLPFRFPMGGRGQFVDITIRDQGTMGGGLLSRLSVEAFDMTRRG